MCFKRILQNSFSHVMHSKRLFTFQMLIESALETKKVTVTSLGQGIKLPIKERSGIRRSDRFIGNDLLHNEIPSIYRQYIAMVVGTKVRLRILIDWSQVPNTKNHILRAALVADGRAITLYEEVHTEAYLNSPKAELPFLETLKTLLPISCNPIIITDAGFRNYWFKKVVALGWDYLGRVRGSPHFFDGESWRNCKEILSKAKLGLRYIGKGFLGKSNSVSAHLYLVKNKSKNRKSTRRKPGGKRDELNHKRAGKEAWLIASSLPGGNFIKMKRIKKLYETRMQIEQGFRDIKSHHFGFGFRNAYSKNPKRIHVLLLISMFAIWVAGIIGRFLEKNNIHLDFQCNSVKNKRVISLVYLGCRALKRGLPLPELDTILIEVMP